MKGRSAFVAILLVTVATLALAVTNFNLSRSNRYRLAYPNDLTTPEQAHAMLVDLEKIGTADEATQRKWLSANYKRFGIDPAKVKKVAIVPPAKGAKESGIILLTNASDEVQARQVLNQSTE